MKKKKFVTNFWSNHRRLIPFARKDYKDRVFQRVFKDKKDLLDLYNAINNSSYSDANTRTS